MWFVSSIEMVEVCKIWGEYEAGEEKSYIWYR